MKATFATLMNYSQQTAGGVRVFTLAVVAGVVFLTASCGKSLQKDKLVGSWEVEGMPKSKQLVFTFREDRTVIISHPKRTYTFGERGTWTLQGNSLVMDLTEEVNFSDKSKKPMVPSLTLRVRITELTDSVLAWKGKKLERGVFMGSGFRLKRTNLPSPTTDSAETSPKSN